jgi:phosphatidate phosphatase APP1
MSTWPIGSLAFSLHDVDCADKDSQAGLPDREAATRTGTNGSQEWAMAWKDIFTKEVEGRKVTGTKSDEGDYRVTTTTASDYEGNVTVDDSSTVVMPPVAAGSKVSIDGEDLDDLRKNLVADGEFSEAGADEIVAGFSE